MHYYIAGVTDSDAALVEHNSSQLYLLVVEAFVDLFLHRCAS